MSLPDEELSELERLRAENRRLKSRLRCTCGLRRAIATTRTEHRMSCPEYVGPLEHRWVRYSINETFGGVDHWCSCGGWFRRGGMAGHADKTGNRTETAEPLCPRADQTWRGERTSD